MSLIGVGKFVCKSCGSRFITKQTLEKHNQTVKCDVIHKCQICNQVFKTEHKLSIHKNKRIKCKPTNGIIEPNQKLAQCEFCNKQLANKWSLTRHYEICSSKNLKPAKVSDPNKLELIEQTIDKFASEFGQKMTEFNELKELLLSIAKSQPTTNNTNVNGNNNLTVNGNVQVNNTTNYINNYLSPNINGLKFTVEHLERVGKILEEFIKLVYCNRSRPENQSVKVISKKEEELAFMDKDGWIVESKESTKQKVTQLYNHMYKLGKDLINGENGPYGGIDAEFNKLPEVYRDKLQKFNGDHSEQRMTIEEVIDIFIRDHTSKSIK